ncbi:hypothetical protein Ciccas_003457 [Cichlidogyrus casuarinus]|uniref:C2 domain-containing protein n=1 Tax=Cichlidogyrus casuarinus TaxID=1844966 RepID=A0ABD2QEA2_9PLAT
MSKSETEIDLEDRILTKYRATCGLASSYCLSGPCQWRDQQTPSEILAAFCTRNRIGEPFYDLENTTYKSPICRVGLRTFVLTKLEKGVPANPHFGPPKERLALYVLNSLNLVKEHVEVRTLNSSLQPGISQGKVDMWVDIFPTELGEPGPPVDINLRKPKEFELRVIIWNTTDVILQETSITGEKMSDIYVKAWISGIDERQSTDVHYRSLDGDGNFNWRFIFPFQFIPAENEITFKKKDSIFSLDATEIRLPPILIVQVWDNDKFSADDFLGTLELNLSELVTPAKQSKKCNQEMVDPTNKKRKMINLFECKRAYGFWPFINDETGDAELTVSLYPPPNFLRCKSLSRKGFISISGPLCTVGVAIWFMWFLA